MVYFIHLLKVRMGGQQFPGNRAQSENKFLKRFMMLYFRRILRVATRTV
jgi:hypothetical protein